MRKDANKTVACSLTVMATKLQIHSDQDLEILEIVHEF